MSDEDSEDSVDDDRDGGWDDYGAQDVNDVVNSAAMQMQNAPDLECDIKADRVVPKPLPQVTPGIGKRIRSIDGECSARNTLNPFSWALKCNLVNLVSNVFRVIFVASFY